MYTEKQLKEVFILGYDLGLYSISESSIEAEFNNYLLKTKHQSSLDILEEFGEIGAPNNVYSTTSIINGEG